MYQFFLAIAVKYDNSETCKEINETVTDLISQAYINDSPRATSLVVLRKYEKVCRKHAIVYAAAKRFMRI